jgi:hypothetical protein
VTIFDWLATHQGMDLVNAVIVVLSAVAAYFSYRTHEHIKKD